LDYKPRSRLGVRITRAIFLKLAPVSEQKYRYTSIPVVVSIVMVPMMVPVPPLPLVPPIFVRVVVVAVAIVAIVIGPDLLVPRIYVNSETVIRFGFGGR